MPFLIPYVFKFIFPYHTTLCLQQKILPLSFLKPAGYDGHDENDG